MGKKSTPQAPPVPDPREIAELDAEFNRIDQFTPFGSLVFGGDSRNEATLSFSPEIQALFNQQLDVDSGLLGQALTRLGGLDPNQIDLSSFGPIQSDAGLNNLNFSGLPGIDPSMFGLGPGQQDALQRGISLEGLPEIPTDINQFRGDVEDAFFQRGRQLLNPEFQRQEESLNQRLANQGLPQGSEAFGEQSQIFGENRNRAFQDLANQSILTGGQEASRQLANILGARQQGFGERLGQGQFNNQAIMSEFGRNIGAFGANAQARSQLTGEQFQEGQFNNLVGQQNLQNQNAGRVQALSEALGIRGNAFNELASLLGLQQVQQPGLSNFFGPGQVDTLGGFGLAQNQANANYQGALNQQQGALGGLFGLGSAALSGAGAAGGFGSMFGK